jgi:hypothetical protein
MMLYVAEKKRLGEPGCSSGLHFDLDTQITEAFEEPLGTRSCMCTTNQGVGQSTV